MKEFNPDNTLYTWLLPFLEQLQDKGLPVTTETHLHVVKILDAVGEQITDAATLLDYLLPVLAHSKEQATIVSAEFLRFMELEQPVARPVNRLPPVSPPIPPRPSWLRRNLRFLLIAAALILCWPLYHWLRGGERGINASYNVLPNTKDLAVIFSADSKAGDTAHLSYQWDFGDGAQGKGVVARHMYVKPGNYNTSLTLQSRDGQRKIDTATSRQLVTVCKPQIQIDPDIPFEIDSGQLLTFTLVYQEAFPPASTNAWTINGTTVAVNTDTFEHVFTETGSVLVQYSEQDSNNRVDGCNSTADKPLFVKSPNVISISLDQRGALIDLPQQRNTKALVALAAIILAVAGTYFITRRILTAIQQNRAKRAEQLLERLKGDEPPYEIPFIGHNEQIDEETDLYKLAKKYNHRIEDDQYLLNINRTIEATIRSEGFIQPVYTNLTVPAEYLVLIDKNKVHSLQVKLFRYLVGKLRKNDVHIEQFWFLKTPAECYNEIYPGGIAVSRMFSLYPEHALVIFSDGHALLDQYYPALNDELVAGIKLWTNHVIFTPVNCASWDHREGAIREKLFLLPADLQGQRLFFDLPEDGRMNYTENLGSIGSNKNIREIDLATIEGISYWLDNDEFLLQWVCALAIYPSLQWDVFVAIGDALQRLHYRDHDVNYSSLLKLVRIPWMTDKFFPAGLRLELLKVLDPVNEKIARETMVRLLNEVLHKLPEKSFAYEELFLQHTADKAILYAHDPGNNDYETYRDSLDVLKILWDKDQLPDQSMAVYLSKDNGKGNWSTMIGNDALSNDPGKSMNIEELFSVKTEQQREKWLRIARIIAWIVGIPAVLLLITALAYPRALQQTGLDTFFNIFTPDNKAVVPVHIRLSNSECLAREQLLKDSTEVSVIIDGTIIPIRSDTLLQVPFRQLTEKEAVFRMTSTYRRFNVTQGIRISMDTVILSATGCGTSAGACTSWEAAASQTIPLISTGNWYEEGILTGAADVCTPVHIETTGIDNNRIAQVSTCRQQPGLTRFTTIAAGGGYKNYFMQHEGSAVISFNEDPTSYKTPDAAQRAAYAPMLQRKISLQVTGQDFTGSGNKELMALGNSWNNRANGDLVLYNDSVYYKNSGWRLSGTSTILTTFGKKIYRLTLANGRNRKQLYLLPIDDASMYIGASPDTNASTGSSTLNMGVFYRYSKGEHLSYLPSLINDIWSAPGNNRFIRFNTGSNILYYSTGGTNTYGTYRVYRVTGNAESGFKIITSSDKGYKVFFVRNLSKTSFELSVCEPFLTLESATQINAGNCGVFNSMQPYYPVNKEAVYLPCGNNISFPGGLAVAEAASFMNTIINGQTGDDRYQVDFYMGIDVSAQYIPGLRSYIQKGLMNQSFTIGSKVYSLGANPFNRSYLRFKLLPPTKISADTHRDTSRWATPTLAPGTATPLAGRYDLGKVTFPGRGAPDARSVQLISRTSKELAANPKAYVTIDAYYYRSADATFRNNVNTVGAMIEKESGRKAQINMIKATSSDPDFSEIKSRGVIRLTGYGIGAAASPLK